MKIIAHTLIKNEEKFVWFAINSVINHVDKILVWDTGSTDRTVDIVRSIKSPKVEFKELGSLTPSGLSKARQEMIKRSAGFDWIFILDGDEMWHDDSLINVKRKIEGSSAKAVVVPNFMLIGDIFHYQEEKAGRYEIAGRRGHFNVRFLKNEKGLMVKGNYPNEAFVFSSGIKAQNLPEKDILFLTDHYLHASFIKKQKFENGIEFPKDYYYPEVLFKDRPDFVISPWKTPGLFYKLNAFWQTPVKRIRRRII